VAPETDPQTGLPTRDTFLHAVGSLAARDAPTGEVAVLALEVPNLRRANAEHGHAAGDLLLREFGARVKSCLRSADLVARIGGSEFGVMLPALIGPGHALLAANQILKACATPIEIAGHPVRVYPPIGIALETSHGYDASRLLSHAEHAMVAARDAPDGVVLYDEDTDDSSPTSLELEADLEVAIENGDIELHYQPKVDLGARRIAGVESLARWHCPVRGPVRPDIFVAAAERCGLILPLTMMTLNIALRDAAELRAERGDLSMAVNLSPKVLNRQDIGSLVERALGIWGIPPQSLVLEVTESAMMSNPRASLETLRRLRDIGARISIDDFGTGYSSLAYIKHLPLSELKIDRSFVMNMVDHSGDRSIVKSVLDLAHNFGLDVVAEGIENEQTLRNLASMGCDYAQGFYIARPMPLDALLEWDEHTACAGLKAEALRAT
jgi:diguanylate cyclase (GGDEF)-like protein